MSKTKKNRKPAIAPGAKVRVEAHVGCEGDQGGHVELHGDTLTVAPAANPTYRHEKTGEPMVSCLTENGALVAVPLRALRRG